MRRFVLPRSRKVMRVKFCPSTGESALCTAPSCSTRSRVIGLLSNRMMVPVFTADRSVKVVDACMVGWFLFMVVGRSPVKSVDQLCAKWDASPCLPSFSSHFLRTHEKSCAIMEATMGPLAGPSAGS